MIELRLQIPDALYWQLRQHVGSRFDRSLNAEIVGRLEQSMEIRKWTAKGFEVTFDGFGYVVGRRMDDQRPDGGE